MSYSFTVRGATKAEALEKVKEQLEGVVQGQPFHLVDQGPALAAAEAFVGILDEDEGKDVVVAVNGSVSWTQGGDDPKFSHASVGVNASLVTKEAA
jgi:hypothetical protein